KNDKKTCSNGHCNGNESKSKGDCKTSSGCHGKNNCCNEDEEEGEGCCNGNKCNGVVITTRADVESTTPSRRHSSPSQQSITSDCNVSPRRSSNIKKGPAPAPPPPTSPNHSTNYKSNSKLKSSSKSLPQSPLKVNRMN